MCLFVSEFEADWLCVMDGKKAFANILDGTKHCYTAITYTHPTINTSAIHFQCEKEPPHSAVALNWQCYYFCCLILYRLLIDSLLTVITVFFSDIKTLCNSNATIYLH